MKTKLHFFCILLALFAGIQQAAAQGTTAFTYQGQLRDGGTNANGAYTMIFKLYDSPGGGNLIGNPNTITTSSTLANGLFTVNLDFGAGTFTGAARWLDITVSNGVTQELSPRVEVLPSPYALYAAVAATVTNGGIMNAQLAGNAVNSTNIQNGAITTAQLAVGAVTNANLAVNAVATTNIQNGAITTALIAANAVNATNIASGQVVKTLNGLMDNVTLVAGTNVSLFTNGNALIVSASVPNIWVLRGGFEISSNAMFVVPANVTRIMVEMWGGGGGGGNGYYYDDGMGDTYANAGGGGGAGAYTFNVFSVTPGTSYAVTAGGGGGHGGTSSFGNLMSAGGGSGGYIANESFSGAGGSGGISTGGLLDVTGEGGLPGNGGASYGAYSGGNGGSVWRGGTGGIQDQDGQAGPGAGGGGGDNGGGAGGAGSAGAVIIYY
jgi:hypothetical protein